MNTCPGIKANGVVCGKRLHRDTIRCTTHMNVLENNGPHMTAQKELSYRHRAAMRNFWSEADLRITLETDPILKTRLREDSDHRFTLLRVEQAREMNLLIREQADEIRETGIDPDAPARQRRDQNREHRQEIMRFRWNQNAIEAQLDAVHQIRNQIAQVNLVIGQADINNRPVVGELARFANDNQNVHTTVAVQQTKDMVARILAIPVPSEYRWNMETCSKTPGEIIMCCKLTPRSAWQMSAKYCQNESVYDLGDGIYGKVLDGVWQYVLKSPDMTDLCYILKQEMEDNVGMCAQGNLTRLCNILSGYMEGIGPHESPAEILGRKLPLLMEMDNEVERLNAAYTLLMELHIPNDQWISWVEPLVEGSVRLVSSGAGQIIGFQVVT